ncbi:MAG: sodium:calcium antiporter [bacterium]|nr:sodium:calcium antiporter [bacterium]
MNGMYLNVLGFLGCTLVIVFSGTRLAKYGDKIADLTGWGKAWVGLILMASVTSLPELMTGISSVTIIDSPDLAAGDVFGSCVFNLLILSFIDVRIQKPLTSLVKTSHLFAGLFGIILLALSGFAIMMSDTIPNLLWISPFSLLLIVVYLFAIYGIYQFDKSSETNHGEQNKAELKKVITAYILNALLVIGAAILLPFFGEQISVQTGLGNSFFGTLFLAASTSLPELVVSIAAIRMGAFDLLVGNLFGSNIFNILILALDDIFYTKGSLFAILKKDHLDSVLIVIIMTAIVGLGLMIKPTKKFWRLSFDTLIILFLYIGLIVVLFVKK